MSGRRFNVVAVVPIGQRTSRAFVDYADGTGELRDMTFPVYPPSHRGHRLRTVRVHEGEHMMLGDAARALGLTAAQVSGLEHGSHALASEAEWDALIAAVRAAKAVRP